MKKRCLLLILLLFAVLMLSMPALAVEEEFEKRKAEMELEMGRALTDREKMQIYNLLVEAKEDRLQKLREAYEPKEKIYYNNTVCAFGPQFREVDANLTRDWYMFTPIDLSEEGEQRFDLIGGGMYVIGSVTVTVRDGEVTVDYEYNSRDVEAGREYFTFFRDFDSVTREDLNRLPKSFSYGKSYSIEEKLDGDTDVILFVCNTATFEKTDCGVWRYYETNEDRVAMRNAMLDMIEE